MNVVPNFMAIHAIVDLMKVLEEMSGDHQHHWDSFSGEHECLQKILCHCIR